MKEKHYTAYVSLSIPIGLAFDMPHTPEDIRKAAIENLNAHPSVQEADLGEWVDRVSIEEDKP
jgi:hypothetical protein